MPKQVSCTKVVKLRMSAWSSSRKFALFTAGALSGLAGYYALNKSDRVEKILETKKVFNSWTTNYTPSPFAKWDENWDQYVK